MNLAPKIGTELVNIMIFDVVHFRKLWTSSYIVPIYRLAMVDLFLY